jgi:O-antigen ligase
MPPVLALVLTFALIFFLFRRDSREKNGVTNAIWIPTLFISISSSRFVSQWLDIVGVHLGGSSMEDGSPLDAVIFFGMMLAGLRVLQQRSVTLSKFARNNRWLTIFLLYCLISVLWSDFPFVAFKRWIKVLAHPIMALVILTDPKPEEAFRAVMKRSAYMLILLSIVFIKYFPQYGRLFDPWSGMGLNCGVANSKNELGALCLLFGVFFFWNLLQAFKIENRKRRRAEIILSVVFLGLILWLIKMAGSSTALGCAVIGIITIWALGLRLINKRWVGMYVLVGILVLVAAEPIFGIYGSALNLLGRDATLTDRTEIWHAALRLQPNPILGAGYESFWLGKRLDHFWDWWWTPNQAHNGYIETYLSLGYVGVALLAGMIIGTFGKISRALLMNFGFARLRLGFLFVILFYNFTEATFKGVHPFLTLFYVIAIDYPMVRATSSRRPSGSANRESREAVLLGGAI